MVVQRKVKKIIKELAEKHDLAEDQVLKIVFSPFGLLRKAMKQSDPENIESFKNVRLMNLGLFAVKPGRVKKLNELRKKKNNRNDGDN